ncbi:hypothetical protein SAMN06272755_2782 [Picosynechococcus sp. OG1]|nr:hypothetical protein SAMN06272755_2782 [Picosynechococcus sp. OG1]SMQ82901.1 hypothetical protein SAMN06272774_2058 [Synechococcus sp. 7002]
MGTFLLPFGGFIPSLKLVKICNELLRRDSLEQILSHFSEFVFYCPHGYSKICKLRPPIGFFVKYKYSSAQVKRLMDGDRL